MIFSMAQCIEHLTRAREGVAGPRERKSPPLQQWSGLEGEIRTKNGPRTHMVSGDLEQKEERMMPLFYSWLPARGNPIPTPTTGGVVATPTHGGSQRIVTQVPNHQAGQENICGSTFAIDALSPGHICLGKTLLTPPRSWVDSTVPVEHS